LYFNDNIKERVGINLACDVPDSHGELPSSPSFCQKVSECSSIISINEMLDSLQQQIDDLPTTTGVQSVTGPNVDNTDPFNPIVEPLGLIKIIDLAGDFFTDLTTATTYIEQFITPTVITDKSFNEGIFFFTVPYLTMVSGNFLTDNMTPSVTTASLIDRFGLLDLISCGDLFYMNAGHHIIGDGYFMYSAFNFFTGSVEMNSLFITASGGNFAESSTGKFIIKGRIGINETAQFGANFFLNSTATIFANASKYTSNVGGIHGDLQTAITNGCNVFFDGIDKENAINKVISFSAPNHSTFPTTQATIDLVDNRVQSNIKIIGDWDASSGSYPLADESNLLHLSFNGEQL
jgi:hypothetical protein